MATEKRLIDANEIKDLFYKQVEYGATDLMDAFDDALQDAQTVDAVEVVHGRWIGYEGVRTIGLDKYGMEIDRCYRYFQCDKCKKKNVVRSNYCPNCGAKMDGEVCDK